VTWKILNSGQSPQTAWRINALQGEEKIRFPTFISSNQSGHFGSIDPSAVVDGPKIHHAKLDQFHGYSSAGM